MPKLCKCGAIVKDRCLRCYPSQQHKKTTKERGYDSRWHRLSVHKRTIDPLCENCLNEGRVTPADEVHHIVPIAVAPELRLKIGNLMSVCRSCHEVVERR